MDDPYQSPQTATAVESPETDPAAPWPAVRRVFLAWEKLRLLYNAILVPWTLAGLVVSWPPSGVVVAEVLVCGILANVLYLAAPTVESYVAWLGFESPLIRWGLFIAGTLFTMLLAAAYVFSIALPNQ